MVVLDFDSHGTRNSSLERHPPLAGVGTSWLVKCVQAVRCVHASVGSGDVLAYLVVSRAEPDDATLALRSRGGDHGAYATLVRRHQAVALRIAAPLGPVEEAEDAYQEAFVKAYSALHRYDRRSLPTLLDERVTGAKGAAQALVSWSRADRVAAPHRAARSPASPYLMSAGWSYSARGR